MTIAIGSDHNGVALKEALLQGVLQGHVVRDFGVFTSDSVDYPDIAFAVARRLPQGSMNGGF
jgi:ribose 5-phosphate isomerase B